MIFVGYVSPTIREEDCWHDPITVVVVDRVNINATRLLEMLLL
jgi:hypothetical protein